MPTYHVEMMEGRTVEQKRKLVEEITRVSVEVLGGSPESVDIIITDIKRHDWATGGRSSGWTANRLSQPSCAKQLRLLFHAGLAAVDDLCHTAPSLTKSSIDS